MSASGARRTQEERRADAERRLLDAAAELIGEVGPSRVTMAAIGQRAGYSRGLAAFHFGSRAELMRRLVDTVTDGFRDAVFAAARSSSVLDQMRALVDVYFTVLSDPRPEHRARLVLWADAVADAESVARPAMLAADRVFRDEIEQAVRRGKADGEVPESVDPTGLATVLVAMLRGVALESLVHDDVRLDACRAEIEHLLTTRLRAQTRERRAKR